MNALLKKEIRLLLPGWVAVMALAIMVPWLFALASSDLDNSFVWTPVVLFFSLILLAVDSFGREFSLGTYSALMSQPLERSRIWRLKILSLFSAAGLVLLAFFASNGVAFHHASKELMWAANPKLLSADFWHAMLGGIAAMFIALTGGLWTTLLLRQISAAFWLTFLTPLGLMMAAIFFLPARMDDAVVVPLFCGLAIIYCGAGFWLAHRLFHRSQDVAWTGGVIAFSTWRYLDTGAKDGVSQRIRRPLTTLIKKEFQLHSISLFCAGALVVLHLMVILMRCVHGRFTPYSFMGLVSEFFWIFWLVMPLVIGCMAVAEERKLGVMNEQFCLPVSRRWQFLIKFVPVMVAGVLLGAMMPLVMEGIAAMLGAPADLFKAEYGFHSFTHFLTNNVGFALAFGALAFGLTLAGFWASTLAKNFLHALSIAIVICVVCCFFCVFMTAVHGESADDWRLAGSKWWGAFWPIAIGILAIPAVIPWLAWRNFNRFAETERLWRRNLLGVGLALIFVFASSALIYNRTWELFEPAEPPHGPAKFTLSNPPVLQRTFWNNLSVRLPDGRVWFDNLSYFNEIESPTRWSVLYLALVNPLPQSGGPNQFMTGSNWISVTPPKRVSWIEGQVNVTRYLDIAAIQADGTLWVSSSDKKTGWTSTNDMVHFGTETNWRQVAASLSRYFLLLKTDGTLWRWDRGSLTAKALQDRWPSPLKNQPEQIGTNSDWQKTYSSWGFEAQDKQGNDWLVDFKDGTNTSLNIDTNFATGNGGNGRPARVRENGTLWIANGFWDEGGNFQSLLNNGFKDSSGHFQTVKGEWLQLGQATDWVTAATYVGKVVALKKDGSLWQWDSKNTATMFGIQPARLGTHSDWVGLVDTWDGVVSLAADGSLWFWPGSGYKTPVSRVPRQPRLLANVLEAAK
ncbi:MAG TPA: hypothetical protein VGO57_09245 [Verrucomicrobiae bacterium]|jgi:ABC-type transport system involved in multi-copper enzyme maturation permease subunit